MFGNKNLGPTTRALAKILFFVIFLSTLVVGLLMISKKNYYGILVIGGGLVCGYLVGYFAHVLGHIAERVDKIESDINKEENERKRLEGEKKASERQGFSGISVSEIDELDELIALKKEGKISQDEFDARFVELVKKK